MRISALLTALAVVLACAAAPARAQTHKVIFDTDFAAPPQDDGLALILALNSPELDILGITTVAGNFSVEKANADVLRVLEIAGRTSIPVYAGANMPLVHEKSVFATTTHGEWWSDDPPAPPPGGFAKKQLERETAVEYLIRAIRANPRQIVILAIGPLTNIAMALKLSPGLAPLIRQIVIMGGAVPMLPDGAGNVTPNAEFNFWVDPEAAYAVLRSGVPIQLSPLNVSRKTQFTRAWFDQIVRIDTPLTRLIADTMGPVFAKTPDRTMLMFDQVAVASLIDPSLVTTRELYVDVEIARGINYGASVGGTRPWPFAEGAQKMHVQYDLDWNRFIRMFVDRVTRPGPSR
jgi:inosine-uridine nucleoside N-ribohydrolase